jgi:hypothetical protein
MGLRSRAIIALIFLYSFLLEKKHRMSTRTKYKAIFSAPTNDTPPADFTKKDVIRRREDGRIKVNHRGPLRKILGF